jgi:type I restriction enzyme S subunit
MRIERRQRPDGAHPVYWASFRPEAPADWKVISISEMAKTFKGKLPTRVLEAPTQKSRPYLLLDGLRGGTHVYTEETYLPSVTESDSVLIADGSKSGFTVRGVAGILGSTLLAFRAREGCNPSFLFHVLSSLFPYLNSATTGTAIPHLDQDLLLQLRLAVPPPCKQAAIAQLLDAADTAIERCEAAIQKARQLRKSLLSDLLSCGVDNNGRVRKRRDLDFVKTPLGRLPATWEISSVGGEFELQNGFTLNADRRPRFRKRKYLRVANVQRDALDLEDVQELEAHETEFALRVLQADDLLVVEGHADRMQIGRCAIVDERAVGFTFQNHLFRLRTRGRVVPGFGCLWLNSEYAQRFWNARCATSSGLNTINQRTLRKLLVPVPRKSEQDKFVELVQSQRTHLESLMAKRDSLAQLKKSLMQDLLTGAVRVKASLSQVAEAV